MARLARALLMASGLLLAAGRPAAAQNQTQGEGLHSLMVAAGKLYFGTAMDTGNFNDPAYMAIVTNKSEFGMFTPENSMKWQVTEPQLDKFSFTQADEVAQKVKSNGQMLRCHTLVWYSQLPTFVANGSWTPATLSAVMTAHITNVVTHYAGQCYAWDVVNEALNEDGTFRQSVFFQTLGSAFIPLAFRAAAAADPRAKLYYNDFNLETTPAKTAGALRIVQLLQSNKTRIDGVGFQAHLAVNHTPPRTSLAATLRRFTALGLEVAYTELDVAQTALPESAAALAQQARDYVAVVGSCLDVPRCVGVTVWQFTDKFSWVPAAFPGRGEACLFASDYSRKPAYDALVALLRGAVTGGGGGGNVTGNGTVGGGPAVGSPGPSFGAGSVVFSGAGRVAVGAVAALVGWAVLGAWILL